MDGLSHRRSSQDMSNSEQEQEKGSCRLKPTLSALPTPSLLVGYCLLLEYFYSAWSKYFFFL